MQVGHIVAETRAERFEVISVVVNLKYASCQQQTYAGLIVFVVETHVATQSSDLDQIGGRGGNLRARIIRG